MCGFSEGENPVLANVHTGDASIEKKMIVNYTWIIFLPINAVVDGAAFCFLRDQRFDKDMASLTVVHLITRMGHIPDCALFLRLSSTTRVGY